MFQRAAVVTRVVSVLTVVAACTAFAFVGAADQPAAQEPDPQVIEQGKNVYVDQCQSCHGAEGKGDGPAARFLDPPPRDLAMGDWQHAADGTVVAVAEVITKGVDDTGMTPFEGTLSDEEIAAVASYVVHVLVTGGAERR